MIRERRMRLARFGALVALLLLALSAAVASPLVSPASAEPASAAPAAGVEVSADGAHYSDQVTTPMFGGLGRLVPGDSVAVTLWVRNAGEIAGVLRFSGTQAWSSTAEFASAITISAGLGTAAPDAPVALGSAAECALLFRGPVLDPGETVPLRITVAFAPTVTGRTGAGERAGLDFVVALRDPAEPASESADCASGTVVPGVPGGSGGTGGAEGRVADTGADVGAPLVAGVLAILAGLGTLAVLAVREARRARGEA